MPAAHGAPTHGVPSEIGGHRILQQIGRGAAGRTYLALGDELTHQARLLICIKAPSPVFARDPRYVEDFRNEAEMASLLTHPHILRPIGGGVGNAHPPFLVYPFVEGLDLGELIAGVRRDGQQLAWPVVATIGLQLAKALEYAHTDTRDSGRAIEHPTILHRDICPENILIGLSGVCFLIDFGIAKALEGSSLIPSLAGSGRLHYSAPERLVEGREYDARVDLFSLGAVLFEALTNDKPFEEAGTVAYVRQVVEGHPPNIRDRRAEFLADESHTSPPPAPVGLQRLVDIVHRLLKPNPHERFPSATALVEALGQIPLDHTAHLTIIRLVETYRPVWRRNVRLRAGAAATTPSAPLFARTDPRQLTQALAAQPQALERDMLRVSPAGARRLLEQRHIPLSATRPGHSDDPSEHVSLETTVPDLTTLPPSSGSDAPDRSNGDDDRSPILTPPPFDEHEPEPSIPTTRDRRPVFRTEPLPRQRTPARRTTPAWAQPPVTQPPMNPGAPIHDAPSPDAARADAPHPFTRAAPHRPVFDPAILRRLQPPRRAGRRRLAVALTLGVAATLLGLAAIAWALLGR